MAGIGKLITASEWEYDLQGQVAEAHPISAILKSLEEKHINTAPKPVCDEFQIPYKKIKRHYYINTTMGEIALTKRELETLNLLLAGKTAKETARLLNISPRVVDEYLENLRRKLNCRKKIEIYKVLNPQMGQ